MYFILLFPFISDILSEDVEEFMEKFSKPSRIIERNIDEEIDEDCYIVKNTHLSKPTKDDLLSRALIKKQEELKAKWERFELCYNRESRNTHKSKSCLIVSFHAEIYFRGF